MISSCRLIYSGLHKIVIKLFLLYQQVWYEDNLVCDSCIVLHVDIFELCINCVRSYENDNYSCVHRVMSTS